MSKPETITMTMRELDRLKVIQSVADSGLTVWRAAEKLGLSRRQVERLVLRYRQDGASGCYRASAVATAIGSYLRGWNPVHAA